MDPQLAISTRWIFILILSAVVFVVVKNNASVSPSCFCIIPSQLTKCFGISSLRLSLLSRPIIRAVSPCTIGGHLASASMNSRISEDYSCNLSNVFSALTDKVGDSATDLLYSSLITLIECISSSASVPISPYFSTISPHFANSYLTTVLHLDSLSSNAAIKQVIFM